MNNNRDISIDLLRFIALSCIILAHVGPTPLLFQLRNFDVPLMVFLSGISYCVSSKRGNTVSYMGYCVKRFKRLILPVWFFLPIYFLQCSITSNELPSFYQVTTYFTFTTNTFYIWIIRVFFIIALFAPLIALALRKINNSSFYAIIISAFALFEHLVHFGKFTSFACTLLLTNIPYIFIFALGYKAIGLNKKQLLVTGGGILTIFIVLILYYYNQTGKCIPTQQFKYPPRLYYTSYALGVCYILWGLRDKIVAFGYCIPSQFTKLCCFIGSHTMWIYLWHISILYAVRQHFNAPIKFLLVYAVALATAYIQCKLANVLVKKISNENIRKDIKTIFIG